MIMWCKRGTFWKEVPLQFFIFQAEEMLNLYLNFNEAKLIYAYKR